jgi:hypothetical protein
MTIWLRRRPSLSVSRAVQYLKGRSSHKLLSEFGSLRKWYWGQHLWARGYWVASSGNVTDEVMLVIVIVAALIGGRALGADISIKPSSLAADTTVIRLTRDIYFGDQDKFTAVAAATVHF